MSKEGAVVLTSFPTNNRAADWGHSKKCIRWYRRDVLFPWKSGKLITD